MGERHTPCHQLHFTVGMMFLQVFSVQLVSLKNAIAHFLCLTIFLCTIRAGGPSGISLMETARDETSVPTSSNHAFHCSQVTPLHPHLQSLPAHHCPLLEPPAEQLRSEDEWTRTGRPSAVLCTHSCPATGCRELGVDGAPGAAASTGTLKGAHLGPSVPTAACEGWACLPRQCGQQPGYRHAGHVRLEGP